MLNFNELPADIKDLIFKKNRPATSKEINENKEKYNIVLDHLEGLIEKSQEVYFVDDEDEPEPSNAELILEYIIEENTNKKAEDERERDWDLYYNNYD